MQTVHYKGDKMSIRKGNKTLAGIGANIDLSNITATGKEVCANASMPSATYDNLTLGASGTLYTAPADGYFTIDIGCSSGQYVNMQDEQNFYGVNQKNYNGGTIRLLLPILKGKKMYLSYDASGTVYGFRFVYANGTI